MNILVVSHALAFGGAQISTLEFLERLKHVVRLKILTCKNSSREFVKRINSLGIHIYQVTGHTTTVYPQIELNDVSKLIEWADIVWITDEIYHVAPRIKGLKKVPVVAHLHSHALICPWWVASYGFKEVCLKRCSPWRIIRCKQNVNLELAKIGLLSNVKAATYWFLDFAKGPIDYFKWSILMRGVIESIDAFIPASETTWRIHTNHIPELNYKPFRVIRNFVTEPLKYIKPNPDEPPESYVLYVSGANVLKGPHLLLKAWSRIFKEFRDLELYMVGCRSTWVEKLAKKLEVRNVMFLDRFSPSKQYYYLMYKAKVVILPSLVPEAFGRVPVEANRLGVPAVVTDIGSLPEIVKDEVTGIIARTDSDSLAEAITKAISREWNRSEIIKNVTERFNPQDATSRLLNFFEDLRK